MTALRWLVTCIALAITGAPASTARAMEATSAVVWVAERDATAAPRREVESEDESDYEHEHEHEGARSDSSLLELHARAPALAPPRFEERHLLNCALLC